MSHRIENLLATAHAQIESHPLRQIINTAHMLQRRTQVQILGARKRYSAHGPPRRVSLTLGVPPRRIDPNRTAGIAIPLSLRERSRAVSIDGQIAAAGCRVLEEEIEPDGERLGQRLERLLFLNLGLAGRLRLLELKGLEFPGRRLYPARV